jgi:hypothetical protein
MKKRPATGFGAFYIEHRIFLYIHEAGDEDRRTCAYLSYCKLKVTQKYNYHEKQDHLMALGLAGAVAVNKTIRTSQNVIIQISESSLDRRSSKVPHHQSTGFSLHLNYGCAQYFLPEFNNYNYINKATTS